MRLKSLKLAGFKSFANPTTFSFKHDITAIVGPNGCGKSNVIDAIRWVLGETSAKQLRGGAMSDVIFAGTDGKAGKSLASVELTFEHTQDEKSGIRHALNLYHELTLRRQITLDGKSDYFINNQRVRRRDVVDVFLGTGLGARSYAVIEQGMIGRIIEADGEKLREFIEEAAGVSRYQARRAETEKQLQIAIDNLVRLSDLQSELTKQYKTLQKQADSAARYTALADELKAVDWQVLTHRLYGAWNEHNHAVTEQKQGHGELELLTTQMTTIRTDWDGLAGKLAEIAWQKDTATAEHHKAQLAFNESKNHFINAENEQNSLLNQLDKITETLTHFSQNTQTQALEKNQHQTALDEILPKLTAVNTQLSQKKHDQTRLLDRLSELKQELSGHYNRRQSLQNELNLNEATTKRVQLSLQKWQQKFDQFQQEKNQLNQLVIDEELPKLVEKMTSLTNRLDELDGVIGDKKQVFEKNLANIGDLSKVVSEQEKQHSKLSSEYDTLHKLVYPPKSQNPTNHGKLVLDQNLQKFPTLTDNLTLTKDGKAYANMLDCWIGVLLSDGVVTDDEFKEFVGKIHEFKLEHSAIWRVDAPSHHTLPDGLVPLSKLISQPNLAIFDCLALATKSFDNLESICAEFGVAVLTSDWLMTSFGAIHRSKFGKADDAFLTTRQAHLDRLAVLEDELNELEESLENSKNHLKIKQNEQEILAKELEEYQVSAKNLGEEFNIAKNAHVKLTSELSAFEKDQARLKNQEIELSKEKNELDYEQKNLETQSEHIRANLGDIAPFIHEKKSEQERLLVEQDALSSMVRTLQNDIQSLHLQEQTHRQAIDFINKNELQAQSEFERLTAEQKSLERRLSELESGLPTLKIQMDEKQKHAYECGIHTQGFDDELKQLQNTQNELSAKRTDTQSKIDKMHEKLGAIGANVAVALAKIQEIGAQLTEKQADFNLTAVLSDFGHNNFKLTGDLKTLTTEQKRLAGEIGKLGAVNLAAMAELTELEARLTPMAKEKQDVEDSITTLQGAIDEINQKTKTLFLDTLQAVNADLNALFGKVFGGGQASLTLMDDETLSKPDKWQAGLVLMAQPKGKKNSRLAVLSGGEKTLTALSLIFAIFKQNPAPFCVLDEVDAPLDDANVGRFTGLIDELARDVQFIFISHNKLAMQTAHELKGVTMPTAGISALVSVDLGEAMKMAEQ